MLKRWNGVHSNRLRAFDLEMIVQAWFRMLGTDMAEVARSFFQYVPQHLQVNDPACHSGDLVAR
jgi:hypothetical protein